MKKALINEAISYPGQISTDGSIEHYLNELNLSHLIENLDVKDNWSSMLSLGEQQRIAIIRALLIKPQMLFLDEASSAMDENIEQKSYKLLKDNLPDTIMISVGHRSTLLGVHRYALLSEDNAEWKFTEASAV